MQISLFTILITDKQSPADFRYFALTEKDAEDARAELSTPAWLDPDRYKVVILPPFNVSPLELGRNFRGAKDFPKLLASIAY